jgi:hypothetical protein
MSDCGQSDTESAVKKGPYAIGESELPDWYPDFNAIPYCENCGRPFPTKRPRVARFCKPACRAAGWRSKQRKAL